MKSNPISPASSTTGEAATTTDIKTPDTAFTAESAPTVVSDPLRGVTDGEPAKRPATGLLRRLDSIDLLRGLVMVIMLLDHTRDFAHSEMMNFEATDLSKTTAAIFFTRWITHYCAPVFVFLAGTGAYLYGARGRSKRELSRFLFTRGLWLVILEFTVVRAVTWFNFDPHFLGMAQVIWAIGVSMMVLAALVHLPLRVVAAIGVAMIALHNLLDPVKVTQWRGPGTPTPSFWEGVWMAFHQPGIIFFGEKTYLLMMYPLVPWIGVMAAGYAFGALYQLQAERRLRILVRLGLSLTVAFVVIRAINIYGDPQPWKTQKDLLFTTLSFLRVAKYPPSLLFLLMTLGPAILALAWFERAGRGPLSRALITFGRVPLFFYILQWIAAHGLAVVAGLVAGQPVAWQFADPLRKPFPNPGNLGFNLGVVYALWIMGVLLIYPLCRWFAGVKQRRNDWWLSYL